MASKTLDMFSSFQEFFDQEQQIREEIKTIVRELEQKAREMLAIIQTVHHNASKDNINLVCQNVRKKLPDVIQHLALLGEKIPAGQYYRFHDHWKFVLQRLVFLVSLINYLEKEELMPRTEAATLLKVHLKWEDGFHLDLDDYLIGVLQLASELSRMCVNTVIAGDYERPIRIASFISELDSAFRLLNLKNDALRKRFDSLKYDLKKAEEVVYDLSIRGLKPKSTT